MQNSQNSLRMLPRHIVSIIHTWCTQIRIVYTDNVPCEQFSRVTFPRLPPSAGEFPTRFMTTLPSCLNQGRVLPPAIGGLGALRLAMSCRLQGFWRSKNWSNQKKDGWILSDCGGFSSLFHWNASKITISCGSSPLSLGWDFFFYQLKKKATGSCLSSAFLSQLPTLEESKPHQHWGFTDSCGPVFLRSLTR